MELEYLIPIDCKQPNISTIETFKHNLQVSDDIKIQKRLLVFKDKLNIPFAIKKEQIAKTENIYFILKLEIDEGEDLNQVNDFIRKLKSILLNISSNLQILYDGVSKYYSIKAYPLIYEVENLMRKLITKFMIANVGIDWTKNEVPDDVKNGIRVSNREKTFLYNIDFIELKRLLFSEKYDDNKEELIKKIKSLKSDSEIEIKELKKLLPTSNWEKYFSKEIDVSSGELSTKWQELYDLRCIIAHNRPFTKSNFDRVLQLSNEITPSIIKAIKNLEKLKIEDGDINDLFQELIFELDKGKFVYIKRYNSLIHKINKVLRSINVNDIYGHSINEMNFKQGLGILINSNIINEAQIDDILYLEDIYQKTFSSPENRLTQEELKKGFKILNSLNQVFQ